MSARVLTCSAMSLGLMVLLSGGCGEDRPPLGEVTGTVTLNGEPLPGASVQFDPGHIRPASGVTDEQGKYKLTFVPGTEGAPLGKNIVRIYPKTSDAAGNNLPQSEIVPIPEKYNEESELSVEVTEGPNHFDFHLESQ